MSSDGNLIVSIKFRLVAKSPALDSRLEILVNDDVLFDNRDQYRLILATLLQTLAIFVQSGGILLFGLTLLSTIASCIRVVSRYKFIIFVV